VSFKIPDSVNVAADKVDDLSSTTRPPPGRGGAPMLTTTAIDADSGAEFQICHTESPSDKNDRGEPIRTLSIGAPTAPSDLPDDAPTILATMKAMGAVSMETRTNAATVAKAIGAERAHNVNRAMAAISKAGYIVSAKGRSGGSWLSDKGRKLLNVLPPIR
jgi:hypothetical protein